MNAATPLGAWVRSVISLAIQDASARDHRNAGYPSQHHDQNRNPAVRVPYVIFCTGRSARLLCTPHAAVSLRLCARVCGVCVWVCVWVGVKLELSRILSVKG